MPTLPIVGARFRPPAQEVLQQLPSGAPLVLRRQPDNPYDENAVQVLLQGFIENYPDIYDSVKNEVQNTEELMAMEPSTIHLGFIPREAAAKVAPLMDQQELNEDGTLPDIPASLTFTMSGQPAVLFGDHSSSPP